MSFKDDVEINRNDLESEVVNQPGQFAYWAEQEALIRKQLDVARNELEVAEAEAYKSVRQSAQASREKVTEKQLDMHVTSLPKIQTLKNKVVQARFELNLASAAVAAFEQRRRMLERIVQLHCFEWGSRVREHADVHSERSARSINRKEA